MTRTSPEFIPTRSSLLKRLENWDDATSWREFYDTYRNLIYNTAIKAGLNDAEANDVVQDTVLSVAKKMRNFKYDPALGSFKGWLLQLIRWRILNQLKKRLPEERVTTVNPDGASEAPINLIPDPASLDLTAYWEREWQKNLLEKAIDHVKVEVSPRQFEIFYLNVIKQFSAGQVASTLNVSRAQVHVAKHRVSALIKKEVRRLEKAII